MAIKMPGKKPPAPSPEEFIAGATAAAPSPAVPTPAAVPIPPELPWLDPRVRDDLRVQLNAKLPERLSLQVDWLTARLGMKKQDVVEQALREWVSARLGDLGLPES